MQLDTMAAGHSHMRQVWKSRQTCYTPAHMHIVKRCDSGTEPQLIMYAKPAFGSMLLGALCAGLLPLLGLHLYLHPAPLVEHVLHALNTAILACQSLCCKSQCPGVQAERQSPDATGPCLILPCSSVG